MPLAPPNPEHSQGARTVAVGDLHGHFEGFHRILEAAGLIDGAGKWIAYDCRLVQTGDILGRGGEPFRIIRLLQRLMREAPEKRSRVDVLLGNHETLGMTGQFAYITPEERSDAKAQFPDQSLRDLLSPEGEVGSWLASLDAALVIDGSLFVHGGLGEKYGLLPLIELNGLIRDELRTGRSEGWSHRLLEGKGASFPGAQSPLFPDRPGPGRLPSGHAGPGRPASGRTAIPQPSLGSMALWRTVGEIVPHRGIVPVSLLEIAEGLKEADLQEDWKPVAETASIVFDLQGPLWCRDLALKSEADFAGTLTRVLDYHGCRRMVVGHTPTCFIDKAETGRILARHGGRLFCIDTGIAKPYGAHLSALVVQGDAVRGLYP